MTITPPPEMTEGMTPSAAKRCIEGFHRCMAIGDFLDEQMQRFEKAESCAETFASFMELFGDCILDLRNEGFLQRDVDVRSVRIWLDTRAEMIREQAVKAAELDAGN